VVVVAGAVMYVKQRRADANANYNVFPVTASRSRNAEDDLRGLQPAKEADNSLISATLEANPNMAVSSAICETSDKSVAVLTDGVVDSGDNSSDDCESKDSDNKSKEKSYAGMELALRSGDGSGFGVEVCCDDSRRLGSPYHSALISAETLSPSQTEAKRIDSFSSEGYEVYDDDDCSQVKKEADYGPVISNMIANYSQKQISKSRDELTTSTEAGYKDPQEGQQDCPSQDYQEGGHYPDASATAAFPQYQNQAHYQEYHRHNQAQHASAHGPQHGQSHEGNGHYSGNAYGNAPHDQHQWYSDTAQQQENAGDTSLTSETSRSSRVSADPPAASYRDMYVSNNNAIGWDASGIQQQQPGACWDPSGVPAQQPIAGWNEWDESGVSPLHSNVGWDESGVCPRQPIAGYDKTGSGPWQGATENYDHNASCQAEDSHTGGVFHVAENYAGNSDQESDDDDL